MKWFSAIKMAVSDSWCKGTSPIYKIVGGFLVLVYMDI